MKSKNAWGGPSPIMWIRQISVTGSHDSLMVEECSVAANSERVVGPATWSVTGTASGSMLLRWIAVSDTWLIELQCKSIHFCMRLEARKQSAVPKETVVWMATASLAQAESGYARKHKGKQIRSRLEQFSQSYGISSLPIHTNMISTQCCFRSTSSQSVPLANNRQGNKELPKSLIPKAKKKKKN